MDASQILNEKKPEIIVIAPTEKEQPAKLRIAAYARVSSDSDDQENSFAAQVKAYTDLIGSKPDWELVDIYADDGITGTRTDKRDDFLRLIRDCQEGKIDRILTKSISRFSRNSMDCLKAVRELRSLDIDIYFEKENIDTSSLSDELMITFFASCAQQESMSISGNLRWSYRHRMKSGRFVTCKAPFGYRLIDGMLQVNETEAAIVRYVFDSYLNGKSKDEIAAELSARGIPTRDGKEKWQYTTIGYMLKNERYIGDALLQKTFATDTLPFQKVRNHGERDQYYVKHSHPPIIPRDTFEKVQKLNQSRVFEAMSRRGEYPLSMKIRCGQCGTPFKRKISGGKVYWACRLHNKDKSSCPVTQIPESEIYAAFLRMYHKLKQNYPAVLTPTLEQLQALKEKRQQNNGQLAELNRKISELADQGHVLRGFKDRGILNDAVFLTQAGTLNQKISALKLEKNRLLEQGGDDSTLTETRSLFDFLKEAPNHLDGFDKGLFDSIVDVVITESNERLRFRLSNGLELPEAIERTVR